MTGWLSVSLAGLHIRRIAKWMRGQCAMTSRVYALMGVLHLAAVVLSAQGGTEDLQALELWVFGVLTNATIAAYWLRRVIHERSYESGYLVGKASHPPAHRVYVVDAETYHRLAEFPPSAFIPREKR